MRHLEIPYPILLDPSKESYRRWCMGRTTLRETFLSPTLMSRYLGLLLKGEPFLGFTPDMFQLGGDFVVDQGGRIAYAHPVRNHGDRAPFDSLIKAMERAAGADGRI